MRLMSPLSLVAVCWGLTAAVAALALAWPERFDLIPVFMWREGQDREAFTLLGAVWLILAALILAAGDLSARRAMPVRGQMCTDLDVNHAAVLSFRVNLLLLAVTVLWLGLTAQKAGGPARLIMLAMTDNLGARGLLLENKLFTGMRLAYAALPATGCLAAMLLATGALQSRERRLCLAVLVANIVMLTVLPVVMSQRLLLLQLLLSSYLAACFVKRRWVALPWLGLGVVLFLIVWVARESLTNPLSNRSWLDLGLQKLAFYFVNDLWNSFAPLQHQIDPTLGGQSFRGLMTLTLTDGAFDRILAARLLALEAVRGGGEFSLLTAPYVDFGPWGAALFLFAAGFLLRFLFETGAQRLSWTAVYAQAGAALLYSSHGLYLAHQNFLFSLIAIAGIARLSGHSPLTTGGHREVKRHA